MAIEDFADLAIHVASRQHAVGEIGAVEVADEKFRVFKLELGGDIAAHLLGGGGGEGVDGAAGEEFLESGELAVFRSEVVAPVADAVGFVNGEGVHVAVAEHGLQGFIRRPWSAHEAFGGDEEHVAEIAGAQVVGDGTAVFGGEGGIELRRGDAQLAKGIDLVFFIRAMSGETTTVGPRPDFGRGGAAGAW